MYIPGVHPSIHPSKVDLGHAQARYDKARRLVEELEALRDDLQLIQQTTAETHTMQSRVELGAGVLVQAHVEDTRYVYVAVGSGFFVQVCVDV